MFDRTRIVIPKETRVLKRKIKCKYDVVVSDRCEFNKTIETDERIFIGELVKLKGSLKAEGDIRIDRLTSISRNINGMSNVYIGERCKIGGELVVEKDLDIGEDVQINPEKLNAKGWVNIRNPIPMIIYLFIYIMELLRQGEGEEVERILEELEAQNIEDFVVAGDFLFMPSKAKVEKDVMISKGRLNVGEDCEVKVKLEAAEDVVIDERSVIKADIQTKAGVLLNADVVVEGDVHADGDMEMGRNVRVDGDIYCNSLKLYNSSKVVGTIHANGRIKFIPDEDEEPVQTGSLVDDLDAMLG